VFFNVNKETPTTQQETNPPMPAASSTVLLFSSEEEAPLTTRTFRLAMLLDDDFACRFAEEEVKRKRVCDWEDEEIEDNAIRCILNLYIYIYCLCAWAFYGAFPRECGFRYSVTNKGSIKFRVSKFQTRFATFSLEFICKYSQRKKKKKKKKKNDALVITDG